MEAYILKTLKKIRKETPRRLKQLLTVCDLHIDELSQKSGTGGYESLPSKYFEPLQWSCESKIPRLMDIAIDALHYMMEYGLFGGEWLNPIESSSTQDKVKLKTKFDFVIVLICNCADEMDDSVQLQVIKALLTAVTSVQCEVREASLLLAIRTCFNIHLMSKNSVNKGTAKAALTQMLSAINQRMEKVDVKLRDDEREKSVESQSTNNVAAVSDEKEDNDDGSNHLFPSTTHKDAFLVFRALCKLSMKGLNDDVNVDASDQIALQNRILSLELILHSLQHSGPAFRSGDRFIHVIRHLLCVSLLRNCTSQITQVTSISLQIFVCLMDGFKDHLKRELEIFVANIFVKILESENATFDHKTRVLEVFHIICTEPSALVELFINYDCDLDAIDLFRRIVDGIAKITKNPNLVKPNPNDFITAVTANKRYATEEHSLRFQGLEGLVIILRTLLRTANLWQGIGESVQSGASKRQSLSDPYSVIAALSYEARTVASGNDVVTETEGDNISPVSEVTSPVPDSSTISAVGNFDRKQKIQEEVETGILKFNISPKQGLKYLSQLHHIEHTPQGVANFLIQYQDRLDKTAVGEYLGREREYENGFCILVLHEYVEAMDFTNMAFDLAIRYFLAGFRLPGEAQKIDRLMEKFAERYYLQNRDKFASADMAFILAFSTIMLQTNLHNPAIRDDKRMTKEQFIKQNKGISQDGELSDELLIEIYDRISAQPISITQNEKEARKPKKEEPTGFAVFQPSLQDKKRKEAFDDERKEMVRASEEMFKQTNRKDNIFLRTGNDSRSDEAYAKPMFEIAWPPILGALSFVLETHDDPAIIELTLRAFKYAVRLACRLDFPTARHTFVNALSKFTTLDTVRAIEYKHLESIKAFVDVATSEGDWLDETWNPVLQTISQLARLQMFADGSQSDDIFYSDSTSTSSNDRGTRKPWARKSVTGSSFAANIDQLTKIFSGPTKAEQVRNVEETNSELIIREIDPSLVDKIFVNSPGLSEGSVFYFVKSLCEVSMLEISGSSAMTSLRGKDGNIDITTPRVFSLQKLVEVADFNMGRPRIAWANIWNLLARHFMTVGVNDNYALAMFAVDSLKQLSIKFLQKEELSNFNFQRVFLKPFEIIMTQCKATEIKDLVLRCIDIMILACAPNIRSGWKSIFAIFEVSTRESTEIATIAFNITERLINKNFDLLVYDFVELINCLVAFVACLHAELSLRALHHLAGCASRLVDGSVDMVAESKHYNSLTDQVPSSQPVDEDASIFRLWWPLLLGLSTAVGDSRLTVRIKALETLQKVLFDHGNIFSPQAWGVIFKGILFPMLDSAKTDFTPQPESSWPAQNPIVLNNSQGWIGTMATPVFNIFIELFKEFEERASPVLLLSDLIKVIEDCICQDNESLARIAVRVYNDLITSLGVNAKGETVGLSNNIADLVCNRLCSTLSQILCFDFGDLGVLDLVDSVPAEIVSQVRGSSPANRRMSKEENIHVYDNPIKTPYGNGHIEKFVDKFDALELGQRCMISLDWGATLYTTDILTDVNAKKIKVNSQSKVSVDQKWRKRSTSLMTSMVVTLDLIKVVTEALDTHSSVWKVSHVKSFMMAIELVFWHARSFNDNYALRAQLQRRGFMQRIDTSILPHLLEQEINSISLIQFVVMKCYGVETGNMFGDELNVLKSFAQPWIQRFGSIMSHYFVALELVLQSKSATEDKTFAINKHRMYNSCVLQLLKSVSRFDEAEFKANKSWMIKALSQLILCDDRNIRLYVSQIYNDQVDGLLLGK